MNCHSAISKMGFTCREIGEATLRVWSPFSCSDGERVGLYVEKINTGYYITDNCEAFMHASAKGINLSANRLDAIRRAVQCDSLVSDSGEISIRVPEEQLGAAMVSVFNASLAVSHFESHWAPRLRAESFTKEVETVLESVLGDRILKKVTVTGASGHQLELPLAIRSGPSLIYVQPIAVTEESAVDWHRVYEGWGRMNDLKNAEIASSDRVVVLEESANDPEMNRAVMMLTDSATVVNWSRLGEWAKRKAA